VESIKYFAVGEYGTRTMRPHYHAIVFGSTGTALSQAWKLGLVHIGSVSPESIAYVCSYALKKGHYPRHARKPFALMSRRPALGADYLRTHTNFHRAGQPICPDGSGPSSAEDVLNAPAADVSLFRSYTMVNGKRGHLPRFYRDRMFSKGERKAMLPLVLKQIDEAHEREQKVLALVERDPANYVIERDRWIHDNILNKFKDEVI